MKDSFFLLEILLILCALSVGMQLARRWHFHRLRRSSKTHAINQDIWVQVYDTDSQEDAFHVRARLQEENLEVLVYEQGRKDVYGNSLKSYGISVPRHAMSRAQNVIVRMPA